MFGVRALVSYQYNTLFESWQAQCNVSRVVCWFSPLHQEFSLGSAVVWQGVHIFSFDATGEDLRPFPKISQTCILTMLLLQLSSFHKNQLLTQCGITVDEEPLYGSASAASYLLFIYLFLFCFSLTKLTLSNTKLTDVGMLGLSGM